MELVADANGQLAQAVVRSAWCRGDHYIIYGGGSIYFSRYYKSGSFEYLGSILIDQYTMCAAFYLQLDVGNPEACHVDLADPESHNQLVKIFRARRKSMQRDRIRNRHVKPEYKRATPTIWYREGRTL